MITEVFEVYAKNFYPVNNVERVGKHLPLAIPIVGAGSAFLLNLVLKSILTPAEYGAAASVLLSIATLFIIGAIGYEQVLTRFLEVHKGRLVISKVLIGLGFLIFIISPFISISVMLLLGLITKLSFPLALCAILIPISTSLSVLFKIRGNLVPHYILLNFWKVALLIVVIFAYVLGGMEADLLLVVASSIGCVLLLALLFARKSDVRIVNAGNSTVVVTFLFAGLTLVFGFVVFDGMDRFVIKTLFSPDIFGDYFFAFTFFMSPVGIVSAYYSARRLPVYKSGVDFGIIRSDYMKVTYISLIILIFFYGVMEVLINFDLVSFVIEERLLLMLSVCFLVVIRSGYSVLSTAYIVISSSRTIMTIGLLFGVLSLLAYLMITTWTNDISIFFCIFTFSFFWALRSVIYWMIIDFELSKLVKADVKF